MNCKFALLLLFLFFSNCAFAKIYASQPYAGGKIEVLIEDAQCADAQIIGPDGEMYSRALDAGGQFEIGDASAGEWSIICGQERKDLDVSNSPGIAARGKNELFYGSKTGAGQNAPAFFVGALLFVIIALAVAGAAAVALEPAPRRGAHISKKRDGKNILLIFCAGSRPIKNVSVNDEVGARWEGAKMKMNAKKLAAFRPLEMRYEYDGEIGKASAAWEEEGEKLCLEIRGEETAFAQENGNEASPKRGGGKPQGICRNGNDAAHSANSRSLSQKIATGKEPQRPLSLEGEPSPSAVRFGKRKLAKL